MIPSTTAFLPHPPFSKKRSMALPSTNSKRLRTTASFNTPDHKVFTQFQPRPFNPYISANPHFQTILANFYPPPPALHYNRFHIRSDDTQALLHIDVANGAPLTTTDQPRLSPPPVRDHTPSEQYAHLPPSPPVVVILHGLESNSAAALTKRIVQSCISQHFKVFVLNNRSCAGPDDIPTTLRLYHAGFTDDLETLLRAIKESAIRSRFRPPDVYLCGFSLGANIVCQFLGRWRARAETRFHVVAAAGACVPFDPTACQMWLDRGWRGWIYSRYLIDTMQAKFEQAVSAGVDIGDVVPHHVRSADRIGLIDEYFITPVFGFKDRLDYYQKVDSRKVLKHITVPTFLINSRDDPFFDHQSGLSLPTDEQIGDAPVMLHLTDHGGHCGFLDKQTFRNESSGYFQTEFARFFSTVRQTLATKACRTFVETQPPDKL